MYKFGAVFARRLKWKPRGYGDTFYIDEVFVKINGKQHYLWRTVDQDGEVVDVHLQAKLDGAAAKPFFKRLVRSHGGEPGKLVTAHAAVRNLFNLDRLLVRAQYYRDCRMSAFAEWNPVVA